MQGYHLIDMEPWGASYLNPTEYTTDPVHPIKQFSEAYLNLIINLRQSGLPLRNRGARPASEPPGLKEKATAAAEREDAVGSIAEPIGQSSALPKRIRALCESEQYGWAWRRFPWHLVSCRDVIEQ